MKIRAIAIVLLTALSGLTVKAGPFPTFSDPIGYMNVYSVGLFGGKDAYLTGYAYGVADLIADTTNNITFQLKPNTLAYADAVASGIKSEIDYWTNSPDGGDTAGDDGNKWLEANCYYSAAIPTGTENCQFTVIVNGNDLSNRYEQLTTEPRAFIKVLDSVGGSWATLAFETQIIQTPGTYTVSYNIDDPSLYGQEIQAGFVWEGINANPADDWGVLSVTVSNLVLSTGDTNAPTPNPTFFDGPTALSDSSIAMTSTTVFDDAGVEYQFENFDLGYNSGWQSDTNWIDAGPIGPPTTGDVEFVEDPNYAALNSYWEGWDEGGVGAVTPSTFVSVSSGTATVTPPSANEMNFYHTFGWDKALTIGQAYEFSIVSDNSTLDGGTTKAVAFVKAFNGGWGQIAAERKEVTLPMDGSTTTISFTPTNGVYYQIGTLTVGTTSGSYQLSDPSLVGLNYVTPGAPSGLTPNTEYGYRVRARDLSVNTNATPWSSIAYETTLAGDTNKPTPNPMTFVSSDASPQSVKMTATTASDESAVQYYFECVAGDGVDSGWQSSPIYINTGLASNSNFTYRVRARDTSASTNTTDWSTNLVITTLPYPGSFAMSNSLQGFTGNSNQDGTVHEILKANLEFADYADLGRRITFGSSGATFGSFTVGDNGRNVMRTLANGYADTSFDLYFTAEGWTPQPDGGNIFCGLGPGELGAYGVPDWSPNGENTHASFIVQVNGTVVEAWSQTNNSTANWDPDGSTALALATDTKQRIRLSYDAGTKQATVTVDGDYDGITFDADAVVGPIAAPDYSISESKIYFAADDGMFLYDFEIVGAAAPIVPASNLAVTPISGGKMLLTWTGVGGQTYSVEYKTALTDGSWTPELTGIPGQTSMSATSSVSQVADEAFYSISTE